MLKKFAKLVCLSCFALSGTLVADQQMQGSGAQGSGTQGAEIYEGGFTLGLEAAVTDHDVHPYLVLGYISDFFLFDIGFNFVNHNYNNDDNNDQNYAHFNSHLGLRNQVYNNLYVTYGVDGSVVAGDFNNGDNRPWTVGAFVGLDLQITKHFLLSGKIDPYKYSHVGENHNDNLVFADTSISLSYVF